MSNEQSLFNIIRFSFSDTHPRGTSELPLSRRMLFDGLTLLALWDDIDSEIHSSSARQLTRFDSFWIDRPEDGCA